MLIFTCKYVYRADFILSTTITWRRNSPFTSSLLLSLNYLLSLCTNSVCSTNCIFFFHLSPSLETSGLLAGSLHLVNGKLGSNQSILKENQPWIFIGRTDTEAEAPILWPPDVKSRLTGKDPDAGKDWGQEEKQRTEDEMVGRHHRLSGHECEQALRNREGQGSLVCCGPWGHRAGHSWATGNLTHAAQSSVTRWDPRQATWRCTVSPSVGMTQAAGGALRKGITQHTLRLK